MDDSLQLEIGDSSAGFPVLIFKASEPLFPDVRAEDDIVQFRHMRIQSFQGSLQAISTNWSAFTTFSRDETGNWMARPARPVEAEECRMLNRISARTGHTAALVRTSPSKPSASRPTLTVDIIQPNTFFNLIAEVIRVIPTNRPSQVTALLTDYTANLGIRANPDHFDLSPDYEHRLLLTTFWDNFADRAAQLQEGQIIKVLNLRSKVISSPVDGDLSSAGLIAVLHGDHSNSEKILILDTTSPETFALNERKAALFGNYSRSVSPTKGTGGQSDRSNRSDRSVSPTRIVSDQRSQNVSPTRRVYDRDTSPTRRIGDRNTLPTSQVGDRNASPIIQVYTPNTPIATHAPNTPIATHTPNIPTAKHTPNIPIATHTTRNLTQIATPVGLLTSKYFILSLTFSRTSYKYCNNGNKNGS